MCSGAGGLDMAVHAAFNATPAWFAETDTNASRVLAAHWGVPNHGDILETDWRKADQVDIVCAGWPCQPFSLAGKRLGSEDERAIWPYIARALAILRPSVIVLENVAAVINTDEYLRVCVNLLGIGYKVATITMPASHVGGPHWRNRLFIVAHRGISPKIKPLINRQTSPGPLIPTPRAYQRGDCPSEARRKSPGLESVGFHFPGSGWGRYEPAIRHWERLTRPAPPPTEPNTRGKPRLNAAFSEWMMGWPGGWVTAVDGLSRTAQLKIIGNGCVPQQAHAAIQRLATDD